MHPALNEGEAEERFLAIGRGSRRRLFVVFTLREAADETLIRPISARYMHKKEVEHYEKQKDAQIPPAPEER
ncbi:MAG: BrnT family toxin [Propylenella sp.]